jgi:hypothetical protein
MVALTKVNLHWAGLGEEGQVGCWFTPGGADSQSEIEDAAAAIRTIIQDNTGYLPQLKAMLSADQHYSKVSVYYYANAAAPSTYGAEADFGSGGISGTGAAYLPLQSALCATLLTGHLGASYRGRMYFPCTGSDPAAGHQYSSAYVTAVAEMVAGLSDKDGLLWDMARGLDSAGDGGAQPVVWSRAKGLATPITSVKVDSRPDTQRRRNESLAPTSTVTRPYETFSG